MTLKRGMVVLTLVLVFVPSALAATKPWQWTPAHASAMLIKSNPQIYAIAGKFTAADCAGRGTEDAGRFTAFRCSYLFKQHPANLKANRGVLWAKVRQTGSGVLCVSRYGFDRIKASCLAVSVPNGIVDPGRDANPDEEVRRAIAARLDPTGPVLWQTFSRMDCTKKSVGVYDCAFGEGVIGTATVTYYARGAVVTITSLECSEKVAAWVASRGVSPGCTFPP